MSDHIHVFVGMTPTVALSDLVRDVKAGSSGFINEKKWIRGKFNWQEGFGAFSYSHSQIDSVVKYIQNQEEHHRTKRFKEEYVSLLKAFEVQYDERFLFKWIEENGWE
jgi:REP element-mobilizing transposase RayT